MIPSHQRISEWVSNKRERSLISSFRSTAAIWGAVATNNPYVGHSVLALTSAYQLVPIDLSTPTALPVEEATPASALLPAYVSTVSQKPYEPPSLANFVKQQAPRYLENMYMSSDTLRNFGRHADITQSKTREIIDDLDEMRQRMALQKKELVRQVEMLHTLREKTQGLREGGEAILAGRLKHVAEAQRILSDRVDQVLQRSLNSSSTVLSDVEVAWFRELAEIQDKVSSQGTGTSLQERAKMVRTSCSFWTDDTGADSNWVAGATTS